MLNFELKTLALINHSDLHQTPPYANQISHKDKPNLKGDKGGCKLENKNAQQKQKYGKGQFLISHPSLHHFS